MREIEGREEGAPPPVDLAAEKTNGDFVRGLIETGRVDTVHDVSDGGLLVALAEMAMAGGIGADFCVPGTTIEAVPFLFGEDQGRYLLGRAGREAKRNYRRGEAKAGRSAIMARAKPAAINLRVADDGRDSRSPMPI